MSHVFYSVTTAFQPGSKHDSLSDIFMMIPQEAIYISRIYLAAQQAGAGTPIFRLIRRSGDDTGGTRAEVSASAWDTALRAPTCKFYHYTAHPESVGTQIGAFRTTPFQFDAGGVHAGINTWELSRDDHPLIVRPGEFMAVNAFGLDDAATVEITVEFSELSHPHPEYT